MDSRLIVVAGTTGTPGRCIAVSLVEYGAEVREIVRRGSVSDVVAELRRRCVAIAEVNVGSFSDLTEACSGRACLVSACPGCVM